MTEYELNGPWIEPHAPYAIRRRRTMFWRVFAVMAAMAVLTGGLVALSH